MSILIRNDGARNEDCQGCGDEAEALSVCCGTSQVEGTDCCSSCRDHAGFECSICGERIKNVI